MTGRSLVKRINRLIAVSQHLAMGHLWLHWVGVTVIRQHLGLVGLERITLLLALFHLLILQHALLLPLLVALVKKLLLLAECGNAVFRHRQPGQ